MNSLVFTGETVQSVSIEIIDDEISESLETFLGQITSADLLPSNIKLSPSRAVFSIHDDDDGNEHHVYLTLLLVNCCSSQ